MNDKLMQVVGTLLAKRMDHRNNESYGGVGS